MTEITIRKVILLLAIESITYSVLKLVYETRISDEDKRLCGNEIWEQWLGEMHEKEVIDKIREILE